MPGDLSVAAERACADAANAMMAALLPSFEVVAPRPPYPQTWSALPDANDYPIWAAAVEGRAEYVVSENARRYPPRGRDGRHSYDGITYLCTDAFLALLLGDERALD